MVLKMLLAVKLRHLIRFVSCALVFHYDVFNLFIHEATLNGTRYSVEVCWMYIYTRKTLYNRTISKHCSLNEGFSHE